MTDLLGTVREALARAGVGEGAVSIIELDRSGAEQSLVVVLAFVDGSTSPTALVKATSDPGLGTSLASEHANLRVLAARLPEPMRRTVPRPMFCGSVRELTVLVESVLPGKRIKNFPAGWFRSAGFPRTLANVMDWLESYSTVLAPARDAENTPSAADLVRRYRARFARSEAADRLLDRAVEDMDRFPVRAVASHGDFCVENILLDDDGRIGVIDWEHPIDGGWPLGDLLHFLSSLWVTPHTRTAAGRIENHRRLFYEAHAHVSLFRDRASRYLGRLELDPGRAVMLSALAWADMAERKMSSLPAGAEPGDLMPRVFIEDERCRNLELLAENEETYALTPR